MDAILDRSRPLERYCHVHGVATDEMWISNWIYGTLRDRNTSSYIAVANLHTLQFTAASTTSSHFAVFSPVPSASVFKFTTNSQLFGLQSQDSIELTASLVAISRQHLTSLLWTSSRRLFPNCSCPSLCVFATDHAENTEVEVTLRMTVSQSVCLGIEHPCGTCDHILLPVGILLFEICSLVSVGCPLWRDNGSAICSLITQWSESRRTRNLTLLSHLRPPQPGRPGSRIYIPQKQGAPVMLPLQKTQFLCFLPLLLSGPRRKHNYSVVVCWLTTTTFPLFLHGRCLSTGIHVTVCSSMLQLWAPFVYVSYWVEC
jgi:hypothetical protein